MCVPAGSVVRIVDRLVCECCKMHEIKKREPRRKKRHHTTRGVPAGRERVTEPGL